MDADSRPEPTAHRPPALPTAPPPRLAGWNVYFLAKLAFYWQGLIGLHALENLAFALLLLMPLQRRWATRLRSALALPAAAALLYHDSFLPPFERLIAQASSIASFSPAYMAEIAGRFISWPALTLLAVVVAGYRIAALRLRVGVLVVATLVVLCGVERAGERAGTLQPLAQARTGAPATAAVHMAVNDLDAVLRERHADEAQRRVAFKAPAAGAAPFDVIFLHVCSLAWDDLRATGLDAHPLLSGLDIVLTNFNSGASYSGPAVIRMLRATCGATSHSELYSAPADADCYLLPALKRAGFATNVVLNHDGHFDDFLGVVRAQGNPGVVPLRLDALPVAQRSFDDSPIYDDAAVLQRWQASLPAGAPRVAAYFNTISLHDGNRLTGANSGLSSQASYKIRLKKLLDDLDAFVARLGQGERRTVVVLLPEHGAALRGDKMQVAGMREVPTPLITHVPVGIKVVGARRAGPTLRIDAPTSYLAVAHVVSRMLERSPFGAAEFAPQDYVAGLPVTPYVAENAGAVMLQHDGRYFLRIGKEGWSEYAAGQP